MKKYLILFSVMLIVFFLAKWWFVSWSLFPLSSSIESTNGTFTLENELPDPRTEAGGITHNGSFYIFGGINQFGQTLLSSYKYSSQTKVWEKIKDTPQPINHVGVVQDNKYVYLVGGFKPLSLRIRGFMFANWEPLNTLYRYNPAANSWETLASMPEARGAGGVCISNDTIWYVGGINPDKAISNALFGYSIKNNQWFTAPSMEHPRDHLRAESVNGKVYALSGRKDDLRFNLAFVEEYNPATKKWTRMADIPTPRGGFGSSVHNNKIYTYGGENVWSCFDVMEVFDPETNKW
ncbi:MAG TPA: kelch repeat-containing protein, partial [Emticicia sp.]